MDIKNAPHATTVGLKVYAFLARNKGPRSYLGKIMLIAFIGTHIPLLSLLLFAVNSTSLPADSKGRILLVALIATLMGTAATLYLLSNLLMPVTLTYRGLRQYLEHDEVPVLPTEFRDEAGVLMAGTMQTLTKLDGLIHDLRNFDPLTTLPNRSFFRENLEQAIQESPHREQQIAVIMLDIDDFAAINNSLGPERGDRLLQSAANRLRLAVPGGVMLSRIGSDEFAVFQLTDASSEDADRQAQRMIDAFAQPFAIEGETVRLTASVGIAVTAPSPSTAPTEAVASESVKTPQTSQTSQQAEQVLNNADVALRDGKTQGRSGRRIFTATMNDALRQRLTIERDLHEALDREQLHLYYQPQIDTSTGTFKGVEALLRWQHPTRGWVSPGEFIPVAEQTGLILPIGEWVLRTACAENLRWLQAGYPPVRMGVNLSPKQFQDADLPRTIQSVLTDTNYRPSLLDLEITESVLMEDREQSSVILMDLKGLGVTLSLDDFGTGYSSLNYLKRFPLDRLKIDQSFVRGLPEDRNDMAIMRSVIALADCLDMDTIAEGVETAEQVACLRQNGCHDMQGFLFARPMPASDLVRYWESASFADIGNKAGRQTPSPSPKM